MEGFYVEFVLTLKSRHVKWTTIVVIDDPFNNTKIKKKNKLTTLVYSRRDTV